MKKIAQLLLCLLMVGCGKKQDDKTIKVAATPVPQAIMLEHVKEELEKQGYHLKVIEMDDYTLPNRALNDKDVDANFFQHIPFMEEQIKNLKYKIQCFARIHLEPMAIYSEKIKDINDLTIGGTLALPSDPTNEYRALSILQKHGIIELKKGVKQTATVSDIVSNPKNLKFKEVQAALLPRTLKDVDAAAIPTNYALQAHLNPNEDALAVETADSPYVNIIAIRIGDENDPKLMALKKVLLAPAMASFIDKTFDGAIIPVLKECAAQSSDQLR